MNADEASAPRAFRWPATFLARAALVGLLALHAGKIFRLIPIQTWADGQPIVEYANSATYGDIVRDSAFARDGRTWGYDPYLAGGVPMGLGLRAESTLPIYFDRLVRRVAPVEASQKLYTGLALFLAPLLLYAAGRFFQMTPAAALVSAAMASAGCVAHDEISRQLIYRGEVSFWLGVFLSIFNGAALYAWTLSARRAAAAAFLVSAMFVPAADPTLAPVQAAAWAILIATAPADGRRRGTGLVLFGALAAVITNVRWIGPFIESRLVAPPLSAWVSEGWQGVRSLWMPAGGFWLTRLNALIRAYLAVFGLVGLMRTLREKRRLTRALCLWLAVLAAIAFGADAMRLPRWGDWGRYPFAVTVLLLIPAGAFMAETFLRRGSVRVLLFGWYVWFSLTWQLVHPYEPPPVREDLTPREQRLLRDVAQIPPGGRVLVQYGPLFTDGLRLAAAREHLAFAGFEGQAWSPHGSQALFELVGHDWFLYGRPLASFSEEHLVSEFRRNNLRYVVATTPVVQHYFARLSAFEEVPSSGEGAYWIYRLRRPGAGFLLQGTGRLSFGYNRLRIEHASAGRLVTNFRWTPRLTASGGATIHAIKLDSEAVPFIAIDNPVAGQTVEVRLEL